MSSITNRPAFQSGKRAGRAVRNWFLTPAPAYWGGRLIVATTALMCGWKLMTMALGQ